MPGAIMENGAGSYTNHDRDQRQNGVNGSGYSMEKVQDRGSERVEQQQKMAPPNSVHRAVFTNPPDLQEQINKLPPEIAHITQGYMSLSTLLKRLSARTHEDLKAKVLQLSQMPIPSSALNMNGSQITSVDDNSPENLSKKLALLNFAQSTHADWVKALVITNWSRRSEDVSKTIDLKIYLDRQKSMYESAIHEMSEVKRSLPYARMPNPDLKTALQVLSTGKAPWMPELGYILPPPLMSCDVLNTLENLNTLLSIRLNLHEYDNIPLQFKDYTIKSGRVTFKVAGEFEIDLTIADEDPEKQFWFIDLRFLFSPAVLELPTHLRYYIESRVNAVLLTDGLPGCYKLLHEMVLTHKISEFRRQASELARGKWVESLKIEALNRAVSIQYWLDRYGAKGPKSWIVLGVHSGRRKDGRFDPKSASHLFVRWFRDGKEIKDADIRFDTVSLSAEALLKTVIAKHVAYILKAIHEKLQSKPLFAGNEMALEITTSIDEPSETVLKVQVTSKQTISVSVEPITGRFIVGPGSLHNMRAEYGFNSKSTDPANDGHSYIEQLRCDTAADEITTHGLSVGWSRIRRPDLKADDLKQVLPKDTLQVAWFRRPGWRKEWFIAVSLSMGGDRWWLIETLNQPPELTITSHLEIPIRASAPAPTYNFLSTLGIFAAAVVSHYANLKALHSQHAFYVLKSSKTSSSISLPSIFLKLSELLPSRNRLKRTRKPWAKDIVKVTFQGLESTPPAAVPASPSQLELPASTPAPDAIEAPKKEDQEGTLITVTEARIVVPVPATLSILKERVDQDIAFHAESGTFACRLRSRVGESVIPVLTERAIRIERLVEFVEVLHKHSTTLRCDSISLGKIILLYGTSTGSLVEAGDSIGAVIPQYKAVVDFGAVSSTMTISFEKGNPHLLIADRLARVLNGNEGLNGVAQLLPLTLPALRALDTIEEAWTSLSDKGDVLVFVRAVDWYRFSYSLLPTSIQVSSTTSPRKVVFDLKLQQRKGEPWWFVRRVDHPGKEGDDIDALLKPVWNSSGEGYRGMRVNAVAQPNGIEELLGKLDDVLRAFASGYKPMHTIGQGQASHTPRQVVPVATMAQAQAKSNRPVMSIPKQRQQPTPNQTQSQGMSHSSQMEVVEID
ncbi:hypothetical protein OIDMADRAFT_39144 [Oidiodendron maius Zn]|uniref:Mediator of RNA polymerase II transcription subunit 14 n=1 Tax=Oidiodendron maius (strain Zn) TaxID=913774 RepID=A0A0C3D075_OIDMZ|nr:hypothetical protein OIDMADRAFT_39144 [Oidiodendron maius Zn]